MDLMRSMTQREFEARTAWIEMEMERPSRSDWYAMQVAAEVRRNRVKDPSTVSLVDMKLKTQQPEPVKAPATKDEAAAISRSRWFGFLNIKKDK